MNEPEPSDKPPEPATPQAAKPAPPSARRNRLSIWQLVVVFLCAIPPLVPALAMPGYWLVSVFAIGVLIIGYAISKTTLRPSITAREGGILFGILIAIPLALFVYLWAVCPSVKFGS